MNNCRCGASIPHDPARRKQPRYCARCRAKYGGNWQKIVKRKERKKASKRKESLTTDRKAAIDLKKWRITSNCIAGKNKYSAYRLLNETEVDHAGNREMLGKWFDSKEKAQASADALNGGEKNG